MTQALALQHMLVGAGHSVVHVLVGKTSQRTLPQYFLQKIGAPVTQIANPELGNDRQRRGVSLGSTLRLNLRNVREYIRGVRQIQRAVRLHEPDLIVNFLSLLGGVYSIVYRPSTPIVAVAHQYLLLHPQYVFPKGRWLDRVLTKLYVRMTAARSVKMLAPSFYPLPAARRGRVVVVPPLLRTEVSQLHVAREEGFLLVYLLNTGYLEEVIRWQRQHPETAMHCFVDDKDIESAGCGGDGLELHRLNDDDFLRMMARCRGVVSTAGFDTICEALYLDKPVLVVPVEGYFEQLLNALDAQRAGVAAYDERFDIDRFLDWMVTAPTRVEAFRQWVAQARDHVIREIEGTDVHANSGAETHGTGGDREFARRSAAMRWGSALLLGGAYLLFMWMFLATEGFWSTVQWQLRMGGTTAPQLELAMRFGAAWRHGMEGGWPLFMPGFFALTIALVLWSWQRSWLIMVWEGALLLGVATGSAVALAPFGSRLVTSVFARELGVATIPIHFTLSWTDVATGLMTAGCWTLFILLLVRAIEQRSVRLVLLGLLPYAALYSRWQDGQVLASEWTMRALRGDDLAVLSLVMIPLTAVWIVHTVRGRRSA